MPEDVAVVEFRVGDVVALETCCVDDDVTTGELELYVVDGIEHTRLGDAVQLYARGRAKRWAFADRCWRADASAGMAGGVAAWRLSGTMRGVTEAAVLSELQEGYRS